MAVDGDDIDANALQPSLAEVGLVWFCRAAAIYSMLFGVYYWVRLIGYYEGPLWRFDLMPVWWQIASASLSVLFPFAGIGLWTMASWGPVIWLICAGTETVLYAGFPELFGYRWPVLASHLVVAAIYGGLRYLVHRQRHPAEH